MGDDLHINKQTNIFIANHRNRKMIAEAIYIRVSNSHKTWKCADQELERQIHCFPYVELNASWEMICI
jgi:hypothetical protein